MDAREPNAPEVDYELGWDDWADMVRYSPAPFHRRRLILELVRDVPFASAVDVGCGSGEVLRRLRGLRPEARLVGVDLSEHVLEGNRRAHPGVDFARLDLAEGALDGVFDLVVCSEVVEHIAEWQSALANLRAMCKHTLVLTVPTGRIFPIDRAMGHTQHFDPDALCRALEAVGFAPDRVWSWGFPFHSLYKHLINLRPEASLKGFAGGSYGPVQKGVAMALRAAFYFNTRRLGRQLVIRARAVGGAAEP